MVDFRLSLTLRNDLVDRLPPRTMRSHSLTYIWLEEARLGISSANPFFAKTCWAIRKAIASIPSKTCVSLSSDTSTISEGTVSGTLSLSLSFFPFPLRCNSFRKRRHFFNTSSTSLAIGTTRFFVLPLRLVDDDDILTIQDVQWWLMMLTSWSICCPWSTTTTTTRCAFKDLGYLCSSYP